MQLGAIHSPTPAHVPLLSERARLTAMAPPPFVDWHKAAPPDGDALGNNVMGNCVPCAALRSIQIRRANAWQDTWKPTESQAVMLYHQWAGYNGTIASDIGTDTNTAMADWVRDGINASPQYCDVPVWVSVNPTNMVHIKLAIAHLGGVNLTLCLPEAAEDYGNGWGVPGSGTTWVKGSWGNHRVMVGKYDASSFTARTWGLDVDMAPEFLAAYCVACDAVVSKAWLETTGLSPVGMDLPALIAESQSIKG